MYFSLLSESQSSGGKAVGVMMLPGGGEPQQGLVWFLVMVPYWEDAAGGGKAQFWGVAAVPLLAAVSPLSSGIL